jgi:hypothetical protein
MKTIQNRSTTSILISVVFSLGLSSTALSSSTVQRNCQFTLAITSEGNRADVDWKVIAANNGTSGRVVVTGSGDYKAKAKKFNSGAVEFAFRTDVSKETMTIGDDGEALWDIQFNNGTFIIYAGMCDAAKVTN